MKRVRTAAVTLAAIFAIGAGGIEMAGASPAGGPSVTTCTKYKLFYDLTGTGNDYLSTNLKVCSNHSFSTGQHTRVPGRGSEGLHVHLYEQCGLPRTEDRHRFQLQDEARRHRGPARWHLVRNKDQLVP